MSSPPTESSNPPSKFDVEEFDCTITFTRVSPLPDRISRWRSGEILLLDVLDSLRRRRGGSERLLAYQLERRWRDLDSTAVNTYIRGLFEDLTAKDFRTWHATVIAAAALAATDEPGDTKRSRQRAIKAQPRHRQIGEA